MRNGVKIYPVAGRFLLTQRTVFCATPTFLAIVRNTRLSARIEALGRPDLPVFQSPSAKDNLVIGVILRSTGPYAPPAVPLRP
jgi:hypothetical protein